MDMVFLEQVGSLFMRTIYIEGIMKDFIIFSQYPELINEVNAGIISEKLNKERKKYGKMSFDSKLVSEFVKLYKLNDNIHNSFISIQLMRDIFGHSRISIGEGKTWYSPSKDWKLSKIKDLFQIKGDGDVIEINYKSLDFENKIKAFEDLDISFFPKLAKNIGLNYKKIR